LLEIIITNWIILKSFENFYIAPPPPVKIRLPPQFPILEGFAFILLRNWNAEYILVGDLPT